MSQNSNNDFIESQNSILPSETKNNSLNRHVIAIVCLIAVFMGALHAWDARHAMNADGISYIDIGDAYFRGDWKMAINSYWSPLYSWLTGLALYVLKPTPYYEFTVIHLVNFAIYLFTLRSFHFLLMQLIHYHRHRQFESSKNCHVTFPEWAWVALGYSLFIWSSLTMITISSVTPDLCTTAFLYLAVGILLRIRRGRMDYITFAFLGAVLGFGYLTKAVMFPLAFIFLSLSLFAGNNLRKSLPRSIIAFIIFLFIVTPFIFAISSAKDRFTYGDAGKYNYWWHVNAKHTYHWDGSPPGTGTPVHPTRLIFDKPAIYEFGTPIGGTYPYWYDIAYWTEGIQIKFNLVNQIVRIKNNIIAFYHTLYPGQSILIFGSLLLYLIGRRRWLTVKDIAEQWVLLVPVIMTFGMYSMIQIDDRYTGPFIPILWLGIFSGIRLPDSENSKRLLKYVSIIIVAVILIITARNLIKQEHPSTHVHWQVAETLNQMGVSPGDKVASIGLSHSHFWARLAKVRIVAEIPHLNSNDFWVADSSVQSNAIMTFKETGAKAIVTELMPVDLIPDGWQRIANSKYYVYILSK